LGVDGSKTTAVGGQVQDIKDDVELVRKIERGRWKIENNQMIFYDTNGTTPLLTFNLFDQVGTPTMEDVFERVEVP
jgi:hypothetical protein